MQDVHSQLIEQYLAVVIYNVDIGERFGTRRNLVYQIRPCLSYLKQYKQKLSTTICYIFHLNFHLYRNGDDT